MTNSRISSVCESLARERVWTEDGVSRVLKECDDAAKKLNIFAAPFGETCYTTVAQCIREKNGGIFGEDALREYLYVKIMFDILQENILASCARFSASQFDPVINSAQFEALNERCLKREVHMEGESCFYQNPTLESALSCIDESYSNGDWPLIDSEAIELASAACEEEGVLDMTAGSLSLSCMEYVRRCDPRDGFSSERYKMEVKNIYRYTPYSPDDVKECVQEFKGLHIADLAIARDAEKVCVEKNLADKKLGEENCADYVKNHYPRDPQRGRTACTVIHYDGDGLSVPQTPYRREHADVIYAMNRGICTDEVPELAEKFNKKVAEVEEERVRQEEERAQEAQRAADKAAGKRPGIEFDATGGIDRSENTDQQTVEEQPNAGAFFDPLRYEHILSFGVNLIGIGDQVMAGIAMAFPIEDSPFFVGLTVDGGLQFMGDIRKMKGGDFWIDTPLVLSRTDFDHVFYGNSNAQFFWGAGIGFGAMNYLDAWDFLGETYAKIGLINNPASDISITASLHGGMLYSRGLIPEDYRPIAPTVGIEFAVLYDIIAER